MFFLAYHATFWQKDHCFYLYNHESATENHNNFIKTTKTFANIKKSSIFASFLKNDQKTLDR